MGYVYKATNKLNLKAYIGKTIHSLDYRKAQHLNASNRKEERAIYSAIRKYGSDNFSWEVLYESTDNSALLLKEIEFIEVHDTFGKNGYNLTKGGEGSLGRVMSRETRRKIGEKAKGRVSKMKGRKFPERGEIISKNRLEKFYRGEIINCHRKLTIDQVADIRTKALSNADPNELSIKHEVSISVIRQVIRGRVYKREIRLLGIPEISKYSPKKTFTADQEKTVIKLFNTGAYSRSCLARAFNASISVVCNLIKANSSSKLGLS